MESDFDKAINFVLRWEGGYSDNPNDPGGETNWGISKKAYPHLDIKNLTKEEAIAIYHNDYWLRAGCNKLSYPIDIIVMDTAVNCGVKRALEFLNITHRPETYLLIRLKHYIRLPTAKHFIHGWTRRVISLFSEVTEV